MLHLCHEVGSSLGLNDAFIRTVYEQELKSRGVDKNS